MGAKWTPPGPKKLNFAKNRTLAPKVTFWAENRLLSWKVRKVHFWGKKVRKVHFVSKKWENHTFCSKTWKCLPKPSIFLVLEQHFRMGREMSGKVLFSVILMKIANFSLFTIQVIFLVKSAIFSLFGEKCEKCDFTEKTCQKALLFPCAEQCAKNHDFSQNCLKCFFCENCIFSKPCYFL